jgi:hypothetical protein
MLPASLGGTVGASPTLHAARGGQSPARTAAAELTGDFNGDTYDDLAVGVFLENVGALEDAGAVNVLYGSADGLQATSPDDQLWTQDSVGVPGTAKAGDWFGWGLGTGDFNGDTYADLAIGAPQDDGSARNAGSETVLYGSPSGLTATGSQLWTQDSPGVQNDAEQGDSLGRIAMAGNFNGDTYADLAFSVHAEDLDGAVDAGAVHVLYGSASGLQTTSPADQFWSQDSPDVRDVAQNSDFLGRSLGSGDFNDDTYADLSLGVSQEDVGSAEAAGAINVLYGSASGLQATAPDDQFWTQDSPEVRSVAEEFEGFGWQSQPSGDFNGDTYADLAVSVHGDTVGGTGGGAAAVFYGSASGLQATAPDDQLWTQDSPEVPDQPEEGDFFGNALAAAKLDADGFDDLAIGGPAENFGGEADAGLADVLYGSASGLQTSAPPMQVWHQDGEGVRDAAQCDDFFGLFLWDGDFNGDTYADLAAFAVEEDVSGVADAGAANVLYGSATGTQAASPDDQFWSQDSTDVREVAEKQDCFGCHGWTPEPPCVSSRLSFWRY